MTTSYVQSTAAKRGDAVGFVERALLDFGLMDEFEARTRGERDECMRWIEAATSERAQEARVTRLLDDLALRRPLARPRS
jgi:hypothetical protein